MKLYASTVVEFKIVEVKKRRVVIEVFWESAKKECTLNQGDSLKLPLSLDYSTDFELT